MRRVFILEITLMLCNTWLFLSFYFQGIQGQPGPRGDNGPGGLKVRIFRLPTARRALTQGFCPFGSEWMIYKGLRFVS